VIPRPSADYFVVGRRQKVDLKKNNYWFDKKKYFFFTRIYFLSGSNKWIIMSTQRVDGVGCTKKCCSFFIGHKVFFF
jgi:hypothetical protein